MVSVSRVIVWTGVRTELELGLGRSYRINCRLEECISAATSVYGKRQTCMKENFYTIY